MKRVHSSGARPRSTGGLGTSAARIIDWLFCVLLVGGALRGSAAEPLKGVQRVVFLGDSITYAGAYVEFIEAYFATRFPERGIDFINVGLPSETVSGLSEEGHAGGKFPRPDLHERLDRVLAQTRPDLVFACYGMNDGIYLPLDEGRFDKYREGVRWLREQCMAAGARVILITPPTFDEVKGGHPGYGHTLDAYADWLLEQRADGWDVVDLHGPMNRHLEEQRARDPGYFLAADGVHCGETGHWIIARQILEHLGAKDVTAFDGPDAMLGKVSGGAAVLRLVQQKQRLLKDAWLSAIGHVRPGMNQGLPLADARKQAIELQRKIRELTAANEKN